MSLFNTTKENKLTIVYSIERRKCYKIISICFYTSSNEKVQYHLFTDLYQSIQTKSMNNILFYHIYSDELLIPMSSDDN